MTIYKEINDKYKFIRFNDFLRRLYSFVELERFWFRRFSIRFEGSFLCRRYHFSVVLFSKKVIQ